MTPFLKSLLRSVVSTPRATRPKVRPQLDVLEERCVPATMHWRGNESPSADVPNWSNPNHWQEGVKPMPGDTLVFDGASGRSNNDFPANTVFNKIILEGDGHILTGNRIALGSEGIRDVFDPLNQNFQPNTVLLDILLTGFQTEFHVDDYGRNLYLQGKLDGDAGLLMTGNGKLVINSANSYRGLTTVAAEGTIDLRNALGLGASTSGTVVERSGTLILSGSLNVAAEPLTLGGWLKTKPWSGPNGWGGPSHWGGTVTLDRAPGDVSDNFYWGFMAEEDLYLDGRVTGHGDHMTVWGPGTLYLGTANDMSIDTVNVFNGTVNLRHSQALGNIGLLWAPGSVVELEGGITVERTPLRDGILRNVHGNNVWAGNLEGAHTIDVADGTLVFSGSMPSTVTYPGGVTGPEDPSFPIEKIGPGNLTISGVSTTHRPIDVREGLVQVTNAAGLGHPDGGVRVRMGAQLELSGSLSIAGEPLQLYDGAMLTSMSGANSWGGVITMTGSTHMNVVGGRLTVGGDIDGPDSTELHKTGAGTLELNGRNPYAARTFVDAGTLTVGNHLALGTSTAETIVMAGATLNLDAPMTLREPLSLFGHSGTSVRATESATLLGPVSVSGQVQIETNSVLVISGAIAGPGGVTKTGFANLEFAGAGNNSFLGATKVYGGALLLNKSLGVTAIKGGLEVGNSDATDVERAIFMNSHQIENTAAVLVHHDAEFELQGFSDTVGPLTLDGGLVNTWGFGTLTLGGDVYANSVGSTKATINGRLNLGSASRTFTVTGSATVSLEVTAIVDGPAGTGWTLAGNGSTRLTAANTYLGNTTVSGGRLLVRTTTGLGPANSGLTTVLAGGTLVIHGPNAATGLTVTESLSLAGRLQGGVGTNIWAGPITLVGTAAVMDATDEVTLRASGVVSGAGSVTKTGAGVVEYIGPSNNTYTGTTTVSAGTLLLSKATAMGAGLVAVPGALVIGGSSPATVRHSYDHQIGDLSSVTVNAGLAAATLDLNNRSDSIGSLTMTAGLARTGTGMLTLLGNITTNAAAAEALINGNLRLGGAVSTTAQIADGAAAYDLRIDGPVSGSVGLTKTGVGTLALTGATANTFTGTTTVNAGALVLAKTAGVNAIAGNLTVGDGLATDTVLFAADNQIPDAVAVAILSSGVLDLQRMPGQTADHNEKVGPLTMTGGRIRTGQGLLTLNGNITTNAAATVALIQGRLDLGAIDRVFSVADGPAAADLQIEALISGAAGIDLTKTGAGTLRLMSNNTYIGQTTVDAGVLQVDGTQRYSPIRVNAGTLSGVGTTGTTTFAGGAIDAGTTTAGTTTAGILTVQDLALNAANVFKASLQGTTSGTKYDVVQVSGSVNLGGAQLQLSLGFTPPVGSRFVILENDGLDAIVGTFAGLAEGAVFTQGGVSFRISYRGGSGNDVELTVV